MKSVWSAARRPLRWARRLILTLLALLLLPAALGQWWLLPNLNNYRDDLAGALSDILHIPTRIEAVTAEREGWRLGLRLRGVSLHDPETGAVPAEFSRATVTLNLWRSLWERRPVFGHIRLEGVNLTLEQGADGTPRLRADTGVAEARAPSLSEVVRWLFDAGRLDIIGDRLTVRGRDGVVLDILHPHFQAQDSERGRRLKFSAALSDEADAGRLQVTVERFGINPESRQGVFELHADRLSLTEGLPARWWRSSPPLVAQQEGLTSSAITAALDLHGDWRDEQPTRIAGRLRLSGTALRAGSERGSSALPAEGEISSEWVLEGQRQDDGWRLQGHARFNDGQGRTVAPSPFEVVQSGEQWLGRIRDLRVHDVAAWLAPWLDTSARQRLTAFDLQGDLPEVAVRIEPAAGAFTVTAQARDIAFQPVHGLPGLNRLSGTVEFASHQGRVTLDGRKVRVNAPGLLRAPITLDGLAGTLAWTREASGWRVESAGLEFVNADVNARFSGGVTVPDTGSPILDVQGVFREIAVGRVRYYLPILIPGNGLAWLDRALIGGRAVGDLTFRGPFADFPFDKQQGLFEARLQVENATLDYAPGWPRLEKLRAAVTFRNRGLRVEADGGDLLDAKAESVNAWIDDLGRTVVRVQGRAKGPGATMWRAFKDSLVGRELGDDLPDLRISGINTLDLDLTLPLSESLRTPNRVKGQVGLLEGSVTLPSWNLELGRLRGEVNFSEDGLNAEDVQTLLRGEPTRLDLAWIGREDRRALQTRLRGQWGLQALLGEQAMVLERYISGKSRWDAVLTVPTGRRERRNETPPFTLELSSELRGVAVRLPAPLGKVAGEARPLRISLRPRERTSLDVMLDYGENVRAALLLADVLRDPRLMRGELRMNAGTAKLPDAPGLAIIARLPRWEWAASPAPSLREEDAPSPWRVVRSLDARIGELVVGRQSFPNMALNAMRQDDGVRIDLEGDALAGRVIMPDQPSPTQPIRAALRRLHVRRIPDTDTSAAVSKSAAAAIDPRRLPPLLLTASDMRLNDAALGRLRLTTLPQPDGLRLVEFKLDSERQRIDASGAWIWSAAGPRSRLQATLRSRALGETLTAFGYSEIGIARGETEAELTAEWAGGLPDFSPDRLEGVLKLQVGPGQLLDVDPGVGRMVGVLNVQNLMRRLSLDFSDLFQSGMGFDRIGGEFLFKRGQAYTDNLTIEAPAAHIQIQGRAGLKERDYEQRITVTPRFGGALPVAGVIAGGPAVGAAVLLAERLFQKGIERATRYHYALTGSWDRPVMRLMEEPPSTAAPRGSAGDR